MKSIINWSKLSSLNSFCWKSIFSTCCIVWFHQNTMPVSYNVHWIVSSTTKILSPTPQILSEILKTVHYFNDQTCILQHELLSVIFHRISNTAFKDQYKICRIIFPENSIQERENLIFSLFFSNSQKPLKSAEEQKEEMPRQILEKTYR